jgi:1-deoxy-D-xylulose-5-phosphate synthase
VLHNGFGAAVVAHLNDAGIQTPVVRIGWPDEFVEHGNIPALREKHGLTSEVAISKITGHFGKKMSGQESIYLSQVE